MIRTSGYGAKPRGHAGLSRVLRLAFGFTLVGVCAGNISAAAGPKVEVDTRSLERSVFQRSNDNAADVPVRGVLGEQNAQVEARAVPRRGFAGVATGWQTIARDMEPGPFEGRLRVQAGWYDVEVRAHNGAGLIGPITRIGRVGVGEVFITAGQSNSINSGSVRTSPADERVSAFDIRKGSWRHAYDPQPVGGQFPSYAGDGGSPWPGLGDILAGELGVPVGFLSTGAGGSSIDDWAVSADYDSERNDLDVPSLYETNLEPAIETLLDRGGFRAVLFHQGESDSIAGVGSDRYRAALERMIDRSRQDAGEDIVWAVALVSYYRYSNTSDGSGLFNVPEFEERISAAQRAVIAADPLVFLGADTDRLREAFRPLEAYPSGFSQKVHFDAAGLEMHAKLWAAALIGQGVVPSPSPSLNLLPNGGFEAGIVAGWEEPTAGSLTGEARTGRRAFAAGDTGGILHALVPLAPGRYRLTFRARADGDIGRVYAGLRTDSEGATPIQQSFEVDGGWRRCSIRFTLGEAAALGPWVWGSNSADSTGTYMVDDVRLTTAPVIDERRKIGIGTGAWDEVTEAQVLADVERFPMAWYYTWRPTPPTAADSAGPLHAGSPASEVGAGVAGEFAFDASRALTEFIPMVWGRRDAREAVLRRIDTSSSALLGFNEPDNTGQADMSVEEAIQLWPSLEALGIRLGSPCNSSGPPDPAAPFLNEDSWLRRFMREADRTGLRVDFMALHYYTDDPDVERMRADLQRAHDLYGRPIWLTEWALVDWADPDRFTLAETAEFAVAASGMMDDLPFVERHAWFAMYPGGDGWYINTELLDEHGRRTSVGDAFRAMSRSYPLP